MLLSSVGAYAAETANILGDANGDGSNTWAYTRLGHITDKTPAELTKLLSNGNVTITLT